MQFSPNTHVKLKEIKNNNNNNKRPPPAKLAKIHESGWDLGDLDSSSITAQNNNSIQLSGQVMECHYFCT
jgi:hypothetical protein